jgi:hypothetical protein
MTRSLTVDVRKRQGSSFRRCKTVGGQKSVAALQLVAAWQMEPVHEILVEVRIRSSGPISATTGFSRSAAQVNEKPSVRPPWTSRER